VSSPQWDPGQSPRKKWIFEHFGTSKITSGQSVSLPVHNLFTAENCHLFIFMQILPYGPQQICWGLSVSRPQKVCRMPTPELTEAGVLTVAAKGVNAAIRLL